MKAKYDWSLVWQMVKEQKETAPSVDADKAGTKENDITPIIGDKKGNVK